MKKATLFAVLTLLALNPAFAKAEVSTAETVAAATVFGAGTCALGGGIGLVAGTATGMLISSNVQTQERAGNVGAAIGCAVGASIGIGTVVQAAEAPSENELQDSSGASEE